MTAYELLCSTFNENVSKLAAARGATKYCLKGLANQKRLAIKQKILGREYYGRKLVPEDSIYMSHNLPCLNMLYKAVGVVARPCDWIGELEQGSNCLLFSIDIVFLRDPSTELNSKKKLTAVELACLKDLVPYYNTHYGVTVEEVMDIQYKLRDLKHCLSLAINLCWDFRYNDVISEDFLERGLEAMAELI